MIDETDHPFVAAARKYADHADAAPDEKLGSDVTNFIGMSPDARVQTLQQLDYVMAEDDGSNLRQKARLLTLRRAFTPYLKGVACSAAVKLRT
jgi:hypothetical protein